MGLIAPFVRSPYNYDVEEASDASAYVETMPSLTVQSMTEDADLNVMMQRFGVTGKLPENVRLPSYGDFSYVSDYRSAIEASRAAADSFLQFPADIRASFDNDPQLFLDYVEDPRNIAQVQKWFPKEIVNVDKNNAGGNAPPPSGSAAAPSGAGAPPGNGGAAVSK